MAALYEVRYLRRPVMVERGSAGSGCLEGKVAIVTGAGRGIGRAEAHRFAREGARVVVNDAGGSLVGEGRDEHPATLVAAEIVAAGGEAVADTGDVTDWETGRCLVTSAVETFGRLDVLVNNAGVARPRMSFNMTEDDWERVLSTHVTGAFTATRFAAEHWRAESKRTGAPVGAAVVFTTSVNGLRGVPGHVNYAAAKAAVASMTTVLAQELAPYGVRCNAVAPLAATRMTADLQDTPLFEGDEDTLSPEHVAEIVTWLASPRTEGITGQILEIARGRLQVWEGWRPVRRAEAERAWTLDALDAARDELFGR
jgi:NAD(P)-dependent dehydrogenase (short-subunit alcohol dehydrogenase family)